MKKFDRLPLTKIQPEGWLLDQLRIQMKGLSGKLYYIWDSVGSYSGWLGGTGDSWERVPYYLDGLLPLSYYLDDEEHWKLCMRFIEWTLNSQDETGNFGPKNTWNEQWSRYAMLKVLIQYEEITGDARVIPFVRNYLAYMTRLLQKKKIRGWSKARVPELLYVAKWLHEKTGEEKILEYMREIDGHSNDWCDFMNNLPFPRPASRYINWEKARIFEHEEMEDMIPYHETHIVNVTMGFKHPAIRSLFCEDKDYAKLAKEGLKDIIRRHGVVSGCINGDEHLAGNNPTQGSELCSVVEYMFSLQSLIEVFGDPWYGDLMERLAYNALPATITEDFMGHQYLQQANQILVDDTPRPWFNNDNDSNVFGLEPNFGCCTANMHQGWPKFVNSLWYKEGDGTLVSMVFAPSCVDTQFGEERFSVRLETEYPFRDQLVYQIKEAPDRPMKLKIRIPAWCEKPQLQCEGATVSLEDNIGFAIVEKKFQQDDEIRVQLKMEPKASYWYRNSLAVERGPLVYGLEIKERWEAVKEIVGIRDYFVYPESPWNYALNQSLPYQVEEQEISSVPFSKECPPIRLKVTAKRLEEWTMQGGNTKELPESPVSGEGESETVSLIPFGCT